MTPEELTAIRERAEAATDGPWRAMDYDDDPDDRGVALLGSAQTVTGSHMIGYFHVGEQPQMEADAEFTAHARTDVPALLAEVERLSRENDNLRLEATLHKARARQFEEERDSARADLRAADGPKWRARYEALRADVEVGRSEYLRGLLPDFRGILARDGSEQKDQP